MERLCEAAIEGNLQLLDEIIRADRLILDKVVAGCFNANPLHVAATFGHTEFVQKLLDHKPDLAEVLDSRFRSALHLATIKGHLRIVQALVRKRPEMCLARDRDGRNPLHIAAMEGQVEILIELVEAIPHAARVKVDSGETILHLCVKHNHLDTLSLLMQKITDPQLINTKDNDGNTILHTAVLGKQFQIVRHVLKNSKIEVNATNAYGHTAMDILCLAQKGANPEELDGKIEDFLREAKARRAKDCIQGKWISKKRGALIVVASLIATMAFLAWVNPPGGVWQDNSNGHRAAEAAMTYNPDSYPYFLRANTIGLIASLSIILLLIGGLPFKKRFFMLVLVMIMWLTISSIALTYAFSIVVATPKKDRSLLSSTIVVAVIVWCSVMSLLLLISTIVVAVIVWCSVMALLLLVHTVRMILNVVRERWSRRKVIERTFQFDTGRHNNGQTGARPNLVKGSQADV